MKVFDAAIKDVLNLMTDNIYPVFLKKKTGERKSAAPAPGPTRAAAPPQGGRCCVIL